MTASLPLSPPPCTSSEKLPELNAKSPHSRFERNNFSGLPRRWQFLSLLATHPFPREVLNGMLTYVNRPPRWRPALIVSTPILSHCSNLAIRSSWLISDGSAKLMDVPLIGQSPIGQSDCIVFCSLDAITTSRRHFLQGMVSGGGRKR